METMQKIALVITIIGAINWGLIGAFDINVVEQLLGGIDILPRIVYILVGVCGLINIGILTFHFDPK